MMLAARAYAPLAFLLIARMEIRAPQIAVIMWSAAYLSSTPSNVPMEISALMEVLAPRALA